MALPADFADLTRADTKNAAAWAQLAEYLGERPGWRFARLPAHLGPGLFWRAGKGDRRLEIRPWGGRFETTVSFLTAGDDAQWFFDDFDELVAWIANSGESFVDEA